MRFQSNICFREAYPEGAREFTFAECVWFSLLSLTPQGGGDCPKVRIYSCNLQHATSSAKIYKNYFMLLNVFRTCQLEF